MACLTIAQRRTPCGRAFLALMKSVLKDRRLIFGKLKRVQQFLQTQEEPKFKALVSLEETLEEVLAEGTLSGQGYVDALLAIKTSLNPVDREMFYMSSTSEFWRFYVRDEEIESILKRLSLPMTFSLSTR
jgi:hypothetical protein